MQSNQQSKLLRVAAGSFAGVFILTLFAVLFVRVTVLPTHWSLHTPQTEKLGRALLASTVAGAVLSIILVAGTFVAQKLGLARD